LTPLVVIHQTGPLAVVMSVPAAHATGVGVAANDLAAGPAIDRSAPTVSMAAAPSAATIGDRRLSNLM